MRIRSFLSAAVLLLAFSCAIFKPGVKHEGIIDYKLYQGIWYEIARLPNQFEDGLKCITMTYQVTDEGIMTVSNLGRNRNNPDDVKTLTGRAWIPDSSEPRKIKIQFIWPVTVDYVLIHIDEAKGLAILGSPFKHQLWIISRSASVSGEDFAELVKIAQNNQYKTENLVLVEQDCRQSE